MKTNNFDRWIPVEHLPDQLYLSEVIDNQQNLKISLIGEDSDIDLIIAFERRDVIAYQFTNESNRLRTLRSNDIFSSGWPLFTSKQTSYIDWILKESYESDHLPGLVHYAVTCGEGIMDILALTPPLVYWCVE